MKKSLTFLLLLLCSLATVDAQILGDKAAEAVWPGAKLVRFVDQQERPQYFEFKSTYELSVDQCQKYFDKQLLSKDVEDLQLIREEKDELGYTHYTYQQLIDGIPVLGGRYMVHAYNDKVVSMNGELFDLDHTDSNPTISATTAVSTALASMPASVYAWESHYPNCDEPQRPFPEAELVWVPSDMDFNKKDFTLSYAVEVYALKPLGRNRLFVEATSGEVIAKINLLHTQDTLGTAITSLSGEREITAFEVASSTFHLRDDARNVRTYDMNNSTSYASATDFVDDDNHWDNVNSDQDEIATDTHWAAEVFYDLLQSKGRNSIDNNGHALHSYIHYDSDYGNAFWDGSVGTFGDGNPSGSGITAPAISIDVVGHEFTHGLVDKTADLIYSNESGALNESFADIFGLATNIYGRGIDGIDWRIGSEITLSGEGIRSFDNPNYFNHPDTYGGDYWVDGANVHTNSSVQNHWFYLLTEGGSGTNELGDNYAITGIGWEDAFSIAYRNLTVYLGPSSNYEDAAFYGQLCASDLFGECSSIYYNASQAWNAVGLGVEIPAEFVVEMNVSGSTCEIPATMSFNTSGSSLLSDLLWDFGDGSTSTEQNPTHVYSQEGSYDVTLVANDCEGILTDTLVRQNFINIFPDTEVCDTTVMARNGSVSLSDCGGYILDPGGNENYDNLEQSTLHLTALAGTISLDFISFELESSFDYLFIYDGVDVNAPLIGSYTGTTLAGTVIETTTSDLTLVFTSDGSVTRPGFLIQYTVNGGSGPVNAGFETNQESYLFNELVEVTSTSGNSVLSYDFGDGTVVYNQTNATHAYLSSGTFSIQQIVSNCIGADTISQTVTVGLPGSISINPEEICVTLESGTDSLVSVNLANAGPGELLYRVIPTMSDISRTSEEPFTTFGALTTHVFEEISETNLLSASITVTINGDFDSSTEYATIVVEGTTLGTIGELVTDVNGQDITSVFSVDLAMLEQWLQDETLVVEVQNTTSVDTNFGLDIHIVELDFSYAGYGDVVGELEGSILAGDSIDLAYLADATSLYAGIYETSIELITGDSIRPLINVPVKLIVTGEPELVSTPNPILFGTTFNQIPVERTLYLNNVGTDVLSITDIVAELPDAYTISPTGFDIQPGQIDSVLVTFNTNVAGNYDSYLTIQGNIPDTQIQLNALADAPPVITVSPDSLCVTLESGTMLTDSIHIFNTGPIDLSWEVSSSSRILLISDGMNDPIAKANLLNDLAASEINLDIIEMPSYTEIDLISSLEEIDIVILPYSTTLLTADYVSMSSHLQAFASAGGGVLILRSNGYESFENTGLFTIGSDFTVTGNDLEIPLSTPSDHPLLEGVVAPYVGPVSSAGLYPLASDPDLVALLVTSFPDAFFATKQYGDGNVIYLGTDFAETDPTLAQLLKNSISYLGSGALPSWLSIGTDAGTTIENDSSLVEVDFDATGLYEGEYLSELTITSNDPVTPEFNVFLKMVVTGEAALVVEPNPVDFGLNFINSPNSQNIYLHNTGTAALEITGIASGLPLVYMPSLTNLSIEPGTTDSIELTFEASTVGDFNTNLTLTTNIGEVMVDLLAETVEPPVISTLPTSICDTLMLNQSSFIDFDILNTGLSNLNWTIKGNSANILIWTSDVYTGTPFNSLVTSIENLPFATQITTTEEQDNLLLASLLEGQDVLVFPYSYSSYLDYQNIAPVVQAYANEGGRILFLENSSGQGTENTGIFPLSSNYTLSDETFNSNIPEHQLLRDADLPYVAEYFSTTLGFVGTNDVEVILENDEGRALLAMVNFGDGEAIYFGYDAYSSDPTITTVLNNSFAYLSGALPPWLIVNELNGTTIVDGISSQVIELNSGGLSPGEYMHDLVICSNDQATPELIVPVKLVVEALPVAGFDTRTEISCDGIVDFIDLSLYEPTSWSWNFGDGITSTDQNPLHLYSNSGTYDVQLIVCNDLGCNTVVQQVVVNIGGDFCEEITMEQSGSISTNSCTGVLFDNGGGDGPYTNNVDYTVTIEPNDALSIDLTIVGFQLENCCDYLNIYDGPNINAPLIGSYNGTELVAGDIISSTGGAITIEFETDGSIIFHGFEIEWECVGQPPLAGFDIEADENCPNTIYFNNTSIGAQNYEWNFGDGFTSTEANPAHHYSSAGVRSATLIATNTGGNSISSETFTIQDVPFELEIDVVDSVLINSPFSLAAISSTTLETYAWQFNGITINGENPTISFSTPGVHYVTLTATTADGCSVSVLKEVKAVLMVDADDLQAEFWHKFYPNPTNDQLTLELQAESGLEFAFELRNALGQSVLREEGKGIGRHHYSLKSLPAGVYWAYVYQDAKAVIVEKIIVQD